MLEIFLFLWLVRQGHNLLTTDSRSCKAVSPPRHHWLSGQTILCRGDRPGRCGVVNDISGLHLPDVSCNTPPQV